MMITAIDVTKRRKLAIIHSELKTSFVVFTKKEHLACISEINEIFTLFRQSEIPCFFRFSSNVQCALSFHINYSTANFLLKLLRYPIFEKF